jgi:uncharacterized protein YndB with AHSA1/START domain
VPTEDQRQAGAVVCEVRIDATPETVFGFFTDPELMVRWMGDEAMLNPQPGGAHRIQIAGTNIARGAYVEVEPPERVVLTWGWENEGMLVPAGSSTVEVALIPDGDGTLVRLTHRDLPAEAQDGHRIGWDHYLPRLAVAARGGDPGPDEGPGT